MLFSDFLHPAFVESDGQVAINTSEATGDNAITASLQLSDRVRQAITSDGKLRIVVAL